MPIDRQGDSATSVTPARTVVASGYFFSSPSRADWGGGGGLDGKGSIHRRRTGRWAGDQKYPPSTYLHILTHATTQTQPLRVGLPTCGEKRGRGTDFWHKAPRLMIHPDCSKKRLVRRRRPGNFWRRLLGWAGRFLFLFLCESGGGWGNDDAVWSLSGFYKGGWYLIEKKARMGRGSGVSQGMALSRHWDGICQYARF